MINLNLKFGFNYKNIRIFSIFKFNFQVQDYKSAVILRLEKN